MFTWLAENIGTLIIASALSAVIFAIVFKLVRDKRKGKTSCGCGCSQCPNSGCCHK